MLDKFWDAVRTLMLAFFGPPDVDDEPALKAWIEKMLGWLAFIAAQTKKTQLDDQAVAGLKAIVASPAKWAVVYELIVRMLGDGVIGNAMKIGDEDGAAALKARSDVAELAGKVGIPIGVFIQVLLMLLKLLRR